VTTEKPSHPLADGPALRKRLIAMARHWLCDHTEAEDLVQETFLRTRDSTLPDSASGREAWLITVLQHLCIDHLRRRQRYRLALSRMAEQAVALAAEPATPLLRIEQTQTLEQVLRLLQHGLQPWEAALVLLHQVFDYDHGKLALWSGCALATSRQRLRRALQRLRTVACSDAAAVPSSRPSTELALQLARYRQAVLQHKPTLLIELLRTGCGASGKPRLGQQGRRQPPWPSRAAPGAQVAPTLAAQQGRFPLTGRPAPPSLGQPQPLDAGLPAQEVLSARPDRARSPSPRPDHAA
jgi:RNA polymerase sigma factor (sigma-70 family)